MSIIDAEKMQRELISNVEFQIRHRAKQLVEAKIDYDFNPNDWNKSMLETCVSRLAEAENRLSVLTNMDWNEKPKIVQWALAQ